MVAPAGNITSITAATTAGPPTRDGTGGSRPGALLWGGTWACAPQIRASSWARGRGTRSRGTAPAISAA